MKNLLLVFLIVILHSCLIAETTVFHDDFSANTSGVWTTSGQINASAFSISRSGEDWGGRRNSGILELTNRCGETSYSAGWVFAHASSSAFSNPYNPTLSANLATVSWYLNIRQSVANPGNISSSTINSAAAFILAGNNTNPRNSGQGYALVIGSTGTTDPIRLVYYNSGITSLINLISSNTSGLADVENKYLSVKVTYAPDTNRWEMHLRDDGAGFQDHHSGSLTLQGSTLNWTHTSIELPYYGAYLQGSLLESARTAYFDNLSVVVDYDETLPVQLTSFTAAQISVDYVRLRWATESETNLLGYHVLRGDSSSPQAAQIISPLIQAGNSSQPMQYLFDDHDLTTPGTYYYWLEASEINGVAEAFGPVVLNYNPNPDEQHNPPVLHGFTKLYPNPSGSSVLMKFTTPATSLASLSIYNVRGQRVREFEIPGAPGLEHALQWDGLDFHGASCPSGVYWAVLQIGETKHIRKLTLSK